MNAPSNWRLVAANCLFWAAALNCCMFAGLSLESSKHSLAISLLDAGRAHSSIAPDNLRSAAESLRLSLVVEAPQAGARNMQDTKAWRDLEEKLTGYADRLQLHSDQSNKLDSLIGGRALFSFLGMLVGSFGLLWAWRSSLRQPPLEPNLKFQTGRFLERSILVGGSAVQEEALAKSRSLSKAVHKGAGKPTKVFTT